MASLAVGVTWPGYLEILHDAMGLHVDDKLGSLTQDTLYFD
jgi:hypothetical protein